MFSKSLVILLAAISLANIALASPHLVNRRHHHALAARSHSVARNASGQLENRALRKRCRNRPPPLSSSAVFSSTPVNVASTTIVSSSSAATTTEQQTPPPPPPASTTSTQESAPTQGGDNGNNDNNKSGGNSSGNSGSNNGGDVAGLPSFVTGILSGDGTYYDTGLTACGGTYKNDDPIVAVSHITFDAWPGAGLNPNNNPICNKKIQAQYGDKTVILTIVDRCEGCKEFDIDMTAPSFEKLAPLSIGRLTGVTWKFI